MATIVRATVEIATCLNCLRSAKDDVPITCDAAPTDKPIAMSLSILKSLSSLRAKIPPIIPVIITAHAVSSGIPPIVFEISTAIGVVTDFGSIEIITDNFVWKNLPKSAVEKTAANVAKIKPNHMARLFSNKTSLFLISGYAKAIVAGPKRYVTYFAPEL